MKERPILFSTPMVQAILAGNKTMTRRIINPQPFKKDDSQWWYWNPDKKGTIIANRPPCDWLAFYPPKYGMIGDRLWVRETWTWEGDTSYNDALRIGSFWYKADPDFKDGFGPTKWHPSIHMPRIASRITLEITDVRVERLQGITKEDAYREGVEIVTTKPCAQYKDYEVNDGIFCNPRNSFNSLWNIIHGRDSWNLNPWVWVISFRRL